jgi:hypothetical protein
MNRLCTAITSLSAAAILLVLGTPSAIAKPPASGSNCSSTWVNNEGAMQCFIQGEEEGRAGVKHPHYVACLGGDIFCCQNDDRGAQNCEAQVSTRPTSKADLIRAILAAQRTHLKIAERPAVKGGERGTKSPGPKHKSPR